MKLDLADARQRFHLAFTTEDQSRLPFYTALMSLLEGDDTALTMLAEIRVEQRNPMLILASLHLASLRGHRILTPIYRDARRGHITDPRAAAATVLEVLQRETALVRSELHRSTQTNEPGRSAVFQAVVVQIGAHGYKSVNVVDVGTSAGINLHFDQFPVRAVDDENPLTLVCRDGEGVDRSLGLPNVTSRVGIDRAPLDLAVEADRQWLEACLWPEEPRRMARLEAIEAARPSWPTTTVLTGSALDRLADAVALGDPESLTVVLNSWAVAYFSQADQHAYFEEMSRRCREENVAWVSVESPFAVNWSTSSTSSEFAQNGAQILVTLPGGTPMQWGWCHHHGLWLELNVPD